MPQLKASLVAVYYTPNRHDRNPSKSKRLSHFKKNYSRLTPIFSRLLIVNTMLKTKQAVLEQRHLVSDSLAVSRFDHAWLLESSIMLLELSITLLENIYSTGITHYDCHLTDHKMFIVQATGQDLQLLSFSMVSMESKRRHGIQ
jgi:hypothetical protein